MIGEKAREEACPIHPLSQPSQLPHPFILSHPCHSQGLATDPPTGPKFPGQTLNWPWIFVLDDPAWCPSFDYWMAALSQAATVCLPLDLVRPLGIAGLCLRNQQGFTLCLWPPGSRTCIFPGCTWKLCPQLWSCCLQLLMDFQRLPVLLDICYCFSDFLPLGASLRCTWRGWRPWGSTPGRSICISVCISVAQGLN